MAKESETTIKTEQPPEIARSPLEIQGRILELKEEYKKYNIWLDQGNGQILAPGCKEVQDILRGRILELNWILGEEIEIREGIHYN